MIEKLRPGVINSKYWNPERPPKKEWNKIRKTVLERDNYTCQYCSHKATKFMNIHHLDNPEDNEINNLITCCVACHAVLHVGRSLSLGVVEVYETNISQEEIVRLPRKGRENGKTLEEINENIPKSLGKYAPSSIEWADSLTNSIGEKSRNSLSKSSSVFFVNLNRWQIENS